MMFVILGKWREAFLESTAQQLNQQEELREKRNELPKNSKKWNYGLGGIVVAIAIALGGLSYYQSSHFNSHISINGTNVGGLTAAQALTKLQASVLENQVYVGKTLILNEGQTKSDITDSDLLNIQKILSTQKTFMPSSKAQNYTLVPTVGNHTLHQKMKTLLDEKLTSMNKSLKAPVDAQVQLAQGKIVVTPSVPGQQYDVASLLQAYQNQENNSVVHLNPAYLQPIKENDPIIKKEETALQNILGETVNYSVQGTVYPLKGSDLITKVTISKNNQIIVDTAGITAEVNKINATQSTLNKSFQFKTHAGNVITVQGQTYGWALNVNKEVQAIQQAFEKGQSSVTASNVYGKGWNTSGIGFNNTTNGGIGDTYAEVSIADQRIWLYRNGQMVLTTNVVTGRHDVGEDTHPGVWYIEYKQSPSVLVGSEVGRGQYSQPVKYWAPFTMDGEGFHDASWRTNWSSTAYIHNGSGGCVNTPPSIMPSVYQDLSVGEPVVVY